MDSAELISEIQPRQRAPLGRAALARTARNRLSAIKSFCKNVSTASAAVTPERKERAKVRSTIYNAVTPALIAMHEQLCTVEARARRLMITNFVLMSTIAAVTTVVVFVS